MELFELQEKYKNVPIELKKLKRWVCFKVEAGENGKTAKRPYNPLTGKRARVNDELTWSTFEIALKGVVKYDCNGIGFVLGQGYFGIDLDNHPDELGEYPLSNDEFQALENEFVSQLNSYAERSQSGLGVHIVCQGKLPEGARRKKGSPVEMYDDKRFFAFTGNVILGVPIKNCEQEIIPLWQKYLYTPVVEVVKREVDPNREVLKLSDQEIIETILNSKQADTFYRYYHDGDLSLNKGDASSADASLCTILAFWCGKDIAQMDRIFRNSALMRDKWDELRGSRTYGEITLESACSKVVNVYTRYAEEPVAKFSIKNPTAEKKEKQNTMNLDENGEPIFKIKNINKTYEYNDTGNAIRFYDYFGDLFKYNVTDKMFMFWTGKTWIRDRTEIVRKYANKLIEIMKGESRKLQEELEILLNNPDGKDLYKLKMKVLEACNKNITRVSNKTGKDAMIAEFKTLHDIPVTSDVFNKDDFLLNTNSGVVNLKTGEISPWNRDLLLSQNTNVEVSYEEPVEWLKFLYSVFNNGNHIQTEELISSLQTCLGYSLTGSTKEQVMFLLYGKGSNGKTTLTEQIANVMGDYGSNIASDVLVSTKNNNTNGTFSLAKLQTVRYVETGETDDGGKLNEAKIKIMTGGDSIAAQYKFGNEFSYKPKFKIWMSTNNKPIIRGTDLGIWRRIFLFPFLNSFTGAQKDKNLPEKLRRESAKILGWCIKGFLKYQELGDLIYPSTVQTAVQEYKQQMDIIAQFVEKECTLINGYKTNSKELYSYFKDWAKDNTEFQMKESKFSEDLKGKGILQEKDKNGVRYYVGIKINGRFTVKGEMNA